MEVKRVKIDELKMAPYNPRKISRKVLEKIKRSIQEFGLVQPLVWNRKTKHVVGGNQRLKVLRELGVQEVDVVVVDLDLDKEKALNVALNKLEGSWDMNKLSELFVELEGIEGLDLSLTGFEKNEIEKMTINFVKEEPEYELMDELYETYDYIILYFDNKLDWQVAVDKLGLKIKRDSDSRPGYTRKGLGRVVRGRDVIDRLK